MEAYRSGTGKMESKRKGTDKMSWTAPYHEETKRHTLGTVLHLIQFSAVVISVLYALCIL